MGTLSYMTSLVEPTNGDIVLHDKLRMQMLWQVYHCLAYTERLASAVDSTADFLNSAHLSPFVRVTGNDGFLTMSLLTKRLLVQFVIVRQFSHW